jgi:HEAT repeat protein
MRRLAGLSCCLFSLALLFAATNGRALAQASEPQAAAQPREETAIFITELGSREPFVRRQAAEELARRADTDHLKLVEGYRLQEKNEQVKVALDWALYRMGKSAALFALVRSLDSAQGEQAAAYLKQLDSPQPLYVFLGQTKRVAQARLLEVLAEIGDAETLERIKPALESFEPTVAVAAEQATEQINKRLAQQPAEAAQPTRPRTVGQRSEATP